MSRTYTRAVKVSKTSELGGLEGAWERARRSPRYAHLPPYSPTAFEGLEPTSKAELKNDPWGFVAIDLSEAVRYYETTGTTGVVTPTPRTREDIESNLASVAGGWSALYGHGDRVLSLLPSDIVPVGDLVVGVSDLLGAVSTRVYPYAQGISDWDRVLPLWMRLSPTVIFAAPGVMRELTQLAMNRGVFDDLRGSVHKIMLLGEVSSDAMRHRLAQLWQADVVDASYGSTESGTLATGCTAGRLHLLTGTHRVEVRDADGRIREVSMKEDSEVLDGGLLVTTLKAYARPLLRFEMGDEVTVGLPCSCGTARPSLRVHGRAADSLLILGRTVPVSSLEELVYYRTSALGYLVEVDDVEAPSRMRLLLERASGGNRAPERRQGDELSGTLSELTGLSDVKIAWLNSLPAATRSGGSQKSWKASNVREADW